MNGIHDILNVMQKFRDNSHICTPCCAALWSIVVNSYNAKIAQREGALDKVCYVLEWHLHNGMVVEAACSALWALALEERLTDSKSEKLTLLLLEGLHIHLRKNLVVKVTYLLLACLIHKSELVAFRILVPEEEKDGLSSIISSYYVHQEDPEIVENICTLFFELVQYKDVKIELLSQNIMQLLNEIKVKYASNEEICSIIESTLLRLQNTQTELDLMLQDQTERDTNESQAESGLTEDGVRYPIKGRAEGDITEGQAEGDITEGQAEGGVTARQAEGRVTAGQAEEGVTAGQAEGGVTEGQAEGGVTEGQAEGGVTEGLGPLLF
eukprot:gi/632969455/ref/XP_007901098.1/ PREDICTED: probable inactive protein kinase-like protein SgK071 [Callorhinchus milii]